MDTMPKSQARAKARKYSRQYLTFWYVREVSPGQFAPWAHSSDDERTVATFLLRPGLGQRGLICRPKRFD